jgi:hypothetical protein
MDRRMLSVCCLVVLSTACLSAPARAEDSVPEWLIRSRAITQQLGAALKAELGAAIAKSGPAGAIDVCRTRAPEIAAKLSSESGATVTRTALRVRNPANAPDDLQRAVLEQFDDDLKAGHVEQPLEAALEINRGGSKERRYMRAIPTDAMCLTCHGTSLAPDVAAVIAKQYPADRATGFATGQLRGAFSVVWPAVPLALNH